MLAAAFLSFNTSSLVDSLSHTAFTAFSVETKSPVVLASSIALGVLSSYFSKAEATTASIEAVASALSSSDRLVSLLQLF